MHDEVAVAKLAELSPELRAPVSPDCAWVPKEEKPQGQVLFDSLGRQHGQPRDHGEPQEAVDEDDVMSIANLEQVC